MKHQFVIAAMLLSGIPAMMAQGFNDDDIYYNPKKDKTTSVKTVKKVEKKSNYIANFSDMDVDTYNRRNQYYTTPVDTIGSGAENGEDFVYTQQIQKYYNPKIVVDNADVLADVLANSYGNVEIEINASGYPVFMPSFGYYSWPYYRNYGPWGWNIGFYDPWYAWNWGWDPYWSWGPSWSWGWGPSLAWGPSWSWGPGWGPSWGWGGPGWGGPGWHNHPPMANWSPNGNHSVGSRPGWSSSSRPSVGNHRVPGNSTSRPGSSATRPSGGSSRPGNVGVVNNNGQWQYVNGGHRVPAGNVNAASSGNGSSSRPGYSVGNHRTPAQNVGNGSGNSSSRQNGTNNSNRTTNTNRNYNNSTNSNSNRSYNSNSSTNRGGFSTGGFGGGRSSGGSFGGGRSTGGGGRHR